VCQAVLSCKCCHQHSVSNSDPFTPVIFRQQFLTPSCLSDRQSSCSHYVSPPTDVTQPFNHIYQLSRVGSGAAFVHYFAASISRRYTHKTSLNSYQPAIDRQHTSCTVLSKPVASLFCNILCTLFFCSQRLLL
jgi:hypothetical protein